MYTAVLKENGLLLALTVPEQRFASALGLSIPEHCIYCRMWFSLVFLLPWCVFNTRNQAKPKQGLLLHHHVMCPSEELTGVFCGPPLFSPSVLANRSTPVSTAPWLSSSPMPWIHTSAGKWCYSVICHHHHHRGEWLGTLKPPVFHTTTWCLRWRYLHLQLV